MKNLTYTEMKNIFAESSAPFSYLFLDSLDQNIKTSFSRVGDKKIRLATKSIRCFATLKYLRDALGEKYIGLMTFHLDESIHLLEKGFDHCLMGYPQKMSIEQGRRVQSLSSQNKKLVQMVDSIEQIKWIERIGKEIEHTFEVCVDIDLSLKIPGLNFGVFRSPLKSLSDCESVFEFLKGCSRVKCVGIMGYEAQIAGIVDYSKKNKLFDLIVSQLKNISRGRIYSFRKSVVDLTEKYCELDFINGGGTGSLSMTSKDSSVTEVTIGSGFYCPHLFDHYKEKFEPSCGYAVEISRKPKLGMVTCHGGGFVASGACGVDKVPTVFLPKNLKTVSNEMFGEVQTPFFYNGECSLELGDPIFLRHAKSGELLERFKEVLVIRNNNIIGSWKTYRGEGLSYL